MQTKATPQSRAKNTAENRFQDWCANQPSIVSGLGGIQVHHCAGSSAKKRVGVAMVRIGHWYCIPLTVDEHWLFHNRKREFVARYGRQLDLWLKLIEDYPGEIPDDVREGIMICGL